MELHDVDDALAEIESLAGLDWLKKCTDRLKEMDGAGPARGRYIELPPSGVPPLGYLWYRAKEECALSELGLITGMSTTMQRLACLGKDLSLIRRQAGFAEWWTGFRDGRDFAPAAFQLAVAAGLQRRGWQVELKPEENGRRLELWRPDCRLYALCRHAAGPEGVSAVLTAGGCKTGETADVLYLDCAWQAGMDRQSVLEQYAIKLKTETGPAVPGAVIFTVTYFRRTSGGVKMHTGQSIWLNPVRVPPCPAEDLLLITCNQERNQS
ncbi:hypothetical protein [Desulfotomaculum copahuensis]|uniref:Uncharacterized protein n=1 Tax=Desulfotomaculum copahuensis TaxID=1838280 RepID=A0A1B7LE23_9FIRM|nr:hypothetical protein [Desulfotomaculum copahuensis]OAT81336.1 hypothetical protein A6M21_10665 [Desulfotomaculum copahuensis]